MLAAERRRRILQQARLEGAVRVADLVAGLRVSDVTVRRDLDRLVEQGELLKVHGGAVLATPGGGAAPAPGPEDSEQAFASPSLVVGVLVPKSPYYFKRIVDGIRDTLAQAGGRVHLAVSDYDPAREPELVEALLAKGVDALLLAPSGVGGDEGDPEAGAGWVASLEVPTVLVERRLDGPLGRGISWVRTDHESGALAAVEHLRGLGHERVALFVRGDTPTSRSVLAGWQSAIEACGLATDVPCLSSSDIPSWPHWDAPSVEHLARALRDAQATALLCHSDEDALALLQNGLADEFDVPGQLSVVAYDDEFSEFASPALSAVSPAKLRVGELAARTLLGLLRDPEGAPLHIEVVPTLVVRDSTAAPEDIGASRGPVRVGERA